ncbi:MAG: hypothetical protein JNM18_14945 [Planctomycetaceae bacterium]|nr:hypothetical protein [Planctomycetaceae bacterium]
MSRWLLLALLLCTNVVVDASIGFAQDGQLLYTLPAGGSPGQTIELELQGKGSEAVERFYLHGAVLSTERIDKSRRRITLPPTIPLGEYDLWPITKSGLGTPCRFVIQATATSVEQEPNSTATEAQAITLPATIYGQITPAVDGDWYRVSLDESQGLTIAARSLSLGGTVWPTITVLDPSGAEVAHDALNRLEPVVHLRAQRSGEYRILVQDRGYRGTPAPLYELTLTSAPYVRAAFPLTLERSQTQQVTLSGYQLPGDKPVVGAREPLTELVVDITAPPKSVRSGLGWVSARAFRTEVFDYRHPQFGGVVRFELNDAAATHHVIAAGAVSTEVATPPVSWSQRFATTRAASHTYRFRAEKSQMLWFEAIAERVDRPCDLELVICDRDLKPLETIGGIAIPKEQAIPVPVESRDPAGAWRAPEAGEYHLVVRDLLSVTGDPPDRAYRVSIGPRLEHVNVLAMLGEATKPTAWNVAPGKSLTVPLVVVRSGGHAEPIEIRAVELPPGITVQPLTLGGKDHTAKLTVTAAQDARPVIGALRLLATSKVNGKPLERVVGVALPIAGATPTARLCEAGLIAIP